MKLIKGLEDAKKFLLDLRKFGIDNIPNETLELIKSEGNYHGGFAIAGDVTSLKDCENITSKTINEFGKLDILVNNVGILAPGNVINVTEENYDVVMSVNLKSMILMSKPFCGA